MNRKAFWRLLLSKLQFSTKTFWIPPGSLATRRDATVASLEPAIADDDVLAGHVQAPAVPVPAGLDRNAIVSGVENAIFNQNIRARVGIAAVGVGRAHFFALGVDRHVPDGDIGAERRG